MNLRFVEAFYWVATLGSVTQAASKLSLTQSAVSSRLSALENELGKPLFERRAQRLRLTIIGERFLVQASRFLELRREVQETFANPDAAPATLRIGANESVLHSWLMPFIDALGSSRPRLKLELSIDTTPALHEYVRRGAVDICFGTGPLEADGVRNLALPPIELRFVEAAGRRGAAGNSRGAAAGLATPTPSGLAALEAATLITFQRGSQPTRSLLSQLQELCLTPSRLLFTPSISAMLELIRRRFGVATLPLNVVSAAVATGELQLVDLGIRLPPLPVVASWRPDPASGLMDEVANLADAHARSSAKAAHSRPRSRVTRKT